MHVNSLRCFDFSERTKSASGRSLKRFLQQSIIPYQELLGNYNVKECHHLVCVIIPYQELLGNYNDAETRRQRDKIIPYQELLGNYNLDDKVFKAQHIIPYQELLGNYNYQFQDDISPDIIPYQELLGNYNSIPALVNWRRIIPYQELLGNYNRNAAMRARTALYHTRNCRASTKEAKLLQHTPFSKTKCVPFSALSLYFLRAHSQNGHTALYRLKFPKQ